LKPDIEEFLAAEHEREPPPSKATNATRRQNANARRPAEPPASIDALKIYITEFEELPVVIRDLLYRGVTLFAGRPKVGKSWLTLQIAIAMALGRPLWGKLGIERPGRVVYCALEEPPSRTAGRLKKLMQQPDPLLMNLHFIYTLKPLMAGGVNELDACLAANPADLVVIDTLSAIVRANEKRDVFRSDYNEVNTIRQLADKHKTAILVVTHLRKMAAEYSIDAVAGTTGLTAACDAIWVLRRQPGGDCLLELTGRESEEKSYALRFDSREETFGWNLLGQSADIKISSERKEIIDLLAEEGAQPPKAIADFLSKNRSTIRVLLRKMAEDGDLVNVDKKYQVAAKHSK
jgi:hypothetical protein